MGSDWWSNIEPIAQSSITAGKIELIIVHVLPIGRSIKWIHGIRFIVNAASLLMNIYVIILMN